VADPWLSAQQRHDDLWAELDEQLTAVVEAALAETLARLWRIVLSERVQLTAATTPPDLAGAQQAARETWIQALTRWVRPIAYAAYARQYGSDQVPTAARDAWWADVQTRVVETADRLVEAVRETVAAAPTESVDQLRDRVARVLGMDATTRTVRDQIAAVEQRLSNTALSAEQRARLFARRVGLQAELFRVQAARARSKAYTALAQVTPDDAAHLRDLARQAARSAGDEARVRRELRQVDDQLYRNSALSTSDERDLRRERNNLYRQAETDEATWRNSARRIARTTSTDVLNEATLQRGITSQEQSGDQLIKVWLSSRDERVRPTHVAAHGQTQPLHEPFTVGASRLQRPGDPNGAPGEVIQCRCSISVLTREEHEQIAAVLAAGVPEEPMSQPAVQPDEELRDLPPVMWHGVVAVEGEYTGDGRKFTPGALRTQPLPMPIRMQREDWGGHTGAVVTANLEHARRFDNKIRAWGTFADGTLTPEVDEVQGLMATRMMRGISIDGDDSVFAPEADAEGNLYEVYSSLRLRGATFVAIPAFDEAEVFLGPPPEEWLLEGEPLAVEQQAPDTTPVDLDALYASVSGMPENLVDYWTHGEGAAKIGWGRSGDFDRCRRNLAEYLAPGQLSGACANLHHRALGVWPGQEAAGKTLVASVEAVTFTAADFAQRDLEELTPITVTDDGHIYGHLAGWSTCHTGYSDMCVTPPKSRTDYSLFHVGAVKLADGQLMPVGKITLGGGHADPTYGVRAATEHYDNSAVAVAVVRAYEDRHGPQLSGRIIPGTPPEKVDELLRSPLSGDWRTYNGNLELIAALAVNTPGFPVPRPMVASANGLQVSLVAAGSVNVDAANERRREYVRALAARVGLDPQSRAAALAARINPMKMEA
jgi:hypothetical protein